MKTICLFGFVTICVALATGYGHSHSGSTYGNSKSGHDDHSDDGQASSENSEFAGYDGHEDHHVDYYAYPKYKFEYGVEDHHTGDHHNHWEHRDGDSVKGGYAIAEPDGTKRIVEYSADKHGGFHAIVTKIGHADHQALYEHSSSGGSKDRHSMGGDGGHGGSAGNLGHNFGFTHGH